MDENPPPDDADKDPFTEGQRQAVKRAYTLLNEHFHDALIVVGAKQAAPDDAPATHGSEVTRIYFVGSHKEAMGNVIYANNYLLQGLNSARPE